MLEKLRIQGFKSIQDETFAFGQVNVFIGGNGSGKSNIFEAMGLLSAALGYEITTHELLRRGVRAPFPKRFLSAFKHPGPVDRLTLDATCSDGVGYRCVLEVPDSAPGLRFLEETISFQDEELLVRANGSFAFDEQNRNASNYPSRGAWQLFREARAWPKEVSTQLDLLSRFVIFAPQIDMLRGSFSETADVPPFGLKGGGISKESLDFIRRPEISPIFTRVLGASVWVDSSKDIAEQVRVIQLEKRCILLFIDKFIDTDGGIISSLECNDGILFQTFMAATLLHQDAPRCFAMENIDSILNPAMTRRMMEEVIAVVRQQSETPIGPEQIFLSTHHPTALDAVDLFDDEQRVFVVERNEQGATVATRLQPAPGWTPEDWWQFARNGRLSELWIEGRIRSALGPETDKNAP
ncbi:MAG: AAA family ATPase [Magnetococcales bacterium]|nr:AAA family ATPase [Magnetococcales bacterium]